MGLMRSLSVPPAWGQSVQPPEFQQRTPISTRQRGHATKNARTPPLCPRLAHGKLADRAALLCTPKPHSGGWLVRSVRGRQGTEVVTCQSLPHEGQTGNPAALGIWECMQPAVRVDGVTPPQASSQAQAVPRTCLLLPFPPPSPTVHFLGPEQRCFPCPANPSNPSKTAHWHRGRPGAWPT